MRLSVQVFTDVSSSGFLVGKIPWNHGRVGTSWGASLSATTTFG